MRCSALGLMAMLAVTPGCTSVLLERSTVHQGSTLSDLQYQMVLDNLARIAANPGAMPWHVNLTGGATQVTDSGQGGIVVGANLYKVWRNSFTNLSPAVSGSRTIVQQWGHDPITDGDELRLLRIAYRRACGSNEMPDAAFLDDLAHEIKKQIIATEDLRTESVLFYEDIFAHRGKSYQALDRDTDSTVGDQKFYDPDRDPARDARKTPLAREVAHELDDIVDDLREITPGWYGVGRKHDVPKDARYVAHSGDVYVWVCDWGVGGLSDFTMTILDLASDLHEPTAGAAGGVNYSPGFDVTF